MVDMAGLIIIDMCTVYDRTMTGWTDKHMLDGLLAVQIKGARKKRQTQYIEMDKSEVRYFTGSHYSSP